MPSEDLRNKKLNSGQIICASETRMVYSSTKLEQCDIFTLLCRMIHCYDYNTVYDIWWIIMYNCINVHVSCMLACFDWGIHEKKSLENSSTAFFE